MYLPEEAVAGLTDSIDYDTKLVRASSGEWKRTARFYGDQGCIIHPDDHDGIYFEPVAVESSLPDREETQWPMGDILPDEPLPPEVDAKALKAALELAFVAPSRTSALVVVYKGRLVAEQYAPGIDKDTLLENWSMGKSLTATLAARLMKDGHFTLYDPAPVPEWHGEGDPRNAIRLADVFRMSSGLSFSLYEVLEKRPDGTYHLPGAYTDHYYVYSGAINVFDYVISRPLEYEPIQSAATATPIR